MDHSLHHARSVAFSTLLSASPHLHSHLIHLCPHKTRRFRELLSVSFYTERLETQSKKNNQLDVRPSTEIQSSTFYRA